MKVSDFCSCRYSVFGWQKESFLTDNRSTGIGRFDDIEMVLVICSTFYFSICLVDLSSKITLSSIVIIESLPIVVIIISGGFELEYRSSVLKEMLLPNPYLYTGSDRG